eukprot:gene25242-10888_t
MNMNTSTNIRQVRASTAASSCAPIRRARVSRPNRRCADNLVAHSASVSISGILTILSRFEGVNDVKEKAKLINEYAKQLEPFPESEKTASNRVMGCTAQVWVSAKLDDGGRLVYTGTSDSELTRGLCGVLVSALSGLTPSEVDRVDASMLRQLSLGPAILAPSRANGFANMFETMQKQARLLAGDYPKFPTLRIGRDELVPTGAFAEAQAQYLNPKQDQVDRLAAILWEKSVGVVAHFYMDPEVQGVLMSAAEQWPHIYISDSLVMADTAVKMAKEGCKYITVLGVDFMSENVRAILDESGYKDVQVYRMSPDAIGCSLAEAAESETYNSYLKTAGETPNSMHVVYINTSLVTKAVADSMVPTITCTSSNVVQTVLQGFAQVPEANVWYGPDTYMGRNLAQLFASLAENGTDEEIASIHPDHNVASIKAMLPRLRYYEDGTCIVHHILGDQGWVVCDIVREAYGVAYPTAHFEVCDIVREAYGDAYLTAHFEVPGEMFSLAMQAKARNMGVVGSTSNILEFIAGRVEAALERPHADRLQFVLGTEAGMITSIVRKVQGMLRESGRDDVDIEIVFPVAPQSITTAKQGVSAGSAAIELPLGLSIIPGPASGEGCSLDGGCAACPYMRMNTLHALMDVCMKAGSPAGEAMLEAHQPRPYSETIGGKTVAQAGCVPILHMRHFQQNKSLSDQLVQDIRTRNQAS